MADDWQVGDLALCVKDEAWNSIRLSKRVHVGFGPQPDGVYAVARLHVNQKGALALMFAEWPNKSFAARHFRKIRPDAQEPCEAEFVTLIKRAKQPSKVGA